MPTESLYPEDAYNKIQWLKDMPYERILKVCDAEKAKYLLCWVTACNMLCNYSTSGYAERALRVMNKPERLLVFLEVVKLSRSGFFNTINVNDLLLRHNNQEARNPFSGGLPGNILEILNIENSLAIFDNQNYGKDGPEIIAARNAVIEKRDADQAAFVESVQKGGNELPKAQLSVLQNKV